MGTGYTRQSAANIVDAAVIEAADLNAEFNLLESAFNASTGHSHDGTSGEGPQISLTASVSGTLPIGNGGTGATTAAGAATALGLGTGDSPMFTAINLGHASDTTITRSAAGVIAVEGVTVPLNSITNTHTALGIELGHATDTTITRASAGVIAVEGSNVLMASNIGSTVQAYDAELAALAGLVSAADKLPYFTGSGTASLADFSAFARTLLDDADAAAMRTTLGVDVSGTAQPLDDELTAIAGLVSAADTAPYFTGSGTAALMTVTSAARNILDDASTSAIRSTLGVGTADSVTFGNVTATDVTSTDDVIVGDDLLLGSGAVINWNSGDITLTHTANFVYGGGGQFGWYYNSAGSPPLLLGNQADSASVAVAHFDGDRATPADGDTAYVAMRLSDDGGTQTEFARISWTATDVTDTTEDGKLTFGVMTAGSLADELVLDGSSLSPVTNNGLTLGTTSLQYGGLYLVQNGLISWHNSDVTIQHLSGNYLYASGGTFQFDNNANPMRITNSSNSASNLVTSFESSRSAPANNDNGYVDFKLKDSAGNLDAFARLVWAGTDVTSTSEDGKFSFYLMKAGTLTEIMSLDSTGLTFSNGATAPERYTLLGTITTTSGATQSLGSLTLTNYKFLRLVFNGVSHNDGSNRYLTLDSIRISEQKGAADLFKGFVDVDLTTGIAIAHVQEASGGTVTSYMADTAYSTATTSITVGISGGAFDAGEIKVYGI